MRHELVEREDVGEGSLDDDVATSVTLHFTKQDPVAMWLRSTALCKNGLLCSAGPRFLSGVGSTVICEAFLRGVRRYAFPEKNVLFGGYVGTFLRFSVIFF